MQKVTRYISQNGQDIILLDRVLALERHEVARRFSADLLAVRMLEERNEQEAKLSFTTVFFACFLIVFIPSFIENIIRASLAPAIERFYFAGILRIRAILFQC